jgi:lipoate-protein ligase A
LVRLVDTDIERPELTAAMDEAILDSRIAAECIDTVHLYRRMPPSVSIGYFQAAREVADIEACRRDGVPVVRRVSGGGAIFTDHRQLVYGLAFQPSRPIGARQGFELVCGALVRAIERLGVEEVSMAGINDVLVGRAKISGSAQVMRRGVHLVHGTVLVDADLDAMFRYLRPLPEKLRIQGLSGPAARVTTLAKVLGEPPGMEAVKAVVSEELSAAVGGAPEQGRLSEKEGARARVLEADRYTRPEWNLKR